MLCEFCLNFLKKVTRGNLQPMPKTVSESLIGTRIFTNSLKVSPHTILIFVYKRGEGKGNGSFTIGKCGQLHSVVKVWHRQCGNRRQGPSDRVHRGGPIILPKTHNLDLPAEPGRQVAWTLQKRQCCESHRKAEELILVKGQQET